MPELPEITVIARQMNKELAGKQIEEVEIRQPRILNMPVQQFQETAMGKVVDSILSKGKWIFVKLNPAYFMLINLGMGAELHHFDLNPKLPEKLQFKLTFSDGTGFTIHFWWFGYVHLVPGHGLPEHKLTSVIGVSAMDEKLTFKEFRRCLEGKNMGVKNFLLDQKHVSGIGNVYIHDILFKAGMHPNRKTSTLSETEVRNLYEAMRSVLNRSIQLGGLAYETDFHGKKGGFTADEFLVGYKEGKPCPVCHTTIDKTKTGSTSSYICSRCQKLS